MPNPHDFADIVLHSQFGVLGITFCDLLFRHDFLGVVGGKLPKNVFFSDKRLPVCIISESH
ncbi:MAG: hypothetical protein ACK521_07650 [bacterium]